MLEPVRLQCKYYIDVLSQWCLIADESLARLCEKYGPALDVSIRFVPIAFKEVLAVTREEQTNFYRRSTMISGIHTVPWIVEGGPTYTWEANAVVIAAEELGFDIDTVRRVISRAALLSGEPLGREGAAITFVSREFEIDRDELYRTVYSDRVVARMQADEDEFKMLGLEVRPSFILENAISDHIVLGGAYQLDLLERCVRCLIDDEIGYTKFAMMESPT